ncbi:calmodulin [Phtheirospermum japonicum]|uniref:Calmodulin n=1 Tax=Phtheirospermum japonicum TaxID=374723 RepID=A0A830CFN8_9LAMI|nr:calmodulin [Phtheirospermum japonicum]
MGKFSVIIYISTLAICPLTPRFPLLQQQAGPTAATATAASESALTSPSPAGRSPPPPRPLPPVSAALRPCRRRHRAQARGQGMGAPLLPDPPPRVPLRVAPSRRRGTSRPPEWEDFMDAEDYLNDEEKFKRDEQAAEPERGDGIGLRGRWRFMIRIRMVLSLSPSMSHLAGLRIQEMPSPFLSFLHPADTKNPKLLQWLCKEEISSTVKLAGSVLVQFFPRQKFPWANCFFKACSAPYNESFGYDMGWWKEEHFNASDVDGDGLLNITEFNDFLHPADTKNPKLLQWLCKEEIRERDSDKNGKVDFKEFFHGLFDLVRNYDDEDHNSTHDSDDSVEAPAKVLFKQLDKDGDGYLSDLELLPIIGKIHPSEHYYAKQQMEYIMQQADTDKDGRLTLTEMIENPYVFYSAVFDEDEEDDYGYHDEFR